MNVFGLSGLLIFLVNTATGILVLVKTRHNPANRLWAYFTFAIAIWGFGAFQISLMKDPQSALFWWKFSHLGVIFIPVLFCHFVHRFLELNSKIPLSIIYLIGIFFIIMTLQDKLITGVKWSFNAFYYNFQTFDSLFGIYFIFWSLALPYSYLLLFLNYPKATAIKRQKIKYFFTLTSLGYMGGFACFLPGFGIDIYPYGNFAIAIFSSLMTYVILKYRLLDISIVLRKGLIYSILITFITLIYLIVVSFLEKTLQKSMGYQSIWPSVTITFIIGLLFVPIKDLIQKFLDTYFFNGSHERLFEENKALRHEVAQTEKHKAVAMLASGIAHEIKNPLTAIRTFNEHLSAKKDDPAFMEKYQTIVNNETTRINNLIHELLDFAKPSAPKIEPVNPDVLLEDLITLVEQQCTSHQIEIVKYLNSSKNINADPNQLKQALLNITLNAIEAMPNGGRLTISSQINQKDLIITIEDTGSGIDSKDLPHIFDPFYSKKDHGTGLGLSITQGIIEKHGGKIYVNSTLNKGTEFKIQIKL